jgi:hypothetical protein
MEDYPMFGIGIPELLAAAVLGSFVVLPFWKIFTKAGFPGALSLSQVVPVLNVVALFYLAFSEWPVHRELSQSPVDQGGKTRQ